GDGPGPARTTRSRPDARPCKTTRAQAEFAKGSSSTSNRHQDDIHFRAFLTPAILLWASNFARPAFVVVSCTAILSFAATASLLAATASLFAATASLLASTASDCMARASTFVSVLNSRC